MPTTATTEAHYAVVHYAIVEAALPGEAPVVVGVLVFDPSISEFALKFRRDWEHFAGEEAEVLEFLADDFDSKVRELGPEAWLRECQESWSNVLRITDTNTILSADLERTATRLYQQMVRPKILEFRTHLPLYSARVAAGFFLEDNVVEQAEDWLEMPADLRVEPNMFLVRITGRSMEPKIPDGSICVFRGDVSGTRQGKLLLIERRDVSESGGRYTVKRYRSKKDESETEEWRHSMVRLEPLNPEFEAWELEDDGEKFRVLGEFVRVLDEP